MVEDLIERSGIPAAAVALARHGEVVYERGFGHRYAAGALPVTPDTRFGLGSVTKSFPALATTAVICAIALTFVYSPSVLTDLGQLFF